MNSQEYSSAHPTENSDLPPEILTEYRLFREHMDRNNRNRKLAKQLEAAQTRPKQKSTKRTAGRRAKSTPETKWLKDLVCPFVYGEKIGHDIWPSVTKETFIERWNKKMGEPSLPNYKLMDHFRDALTLYFMGQGWIKATRTLVMIDVDVLKSKRLGSPAGAKRFAAHLKSIWPDLYFEISTNGKGMHGYFILHKRGADAKRTNAALKRLEKWLRHQAKMTNADIELVEIKGTCLDLTLDGRVAQSVTFGSLAKLPRDISRFEEWQSTTALRVQDLEGSFYDLTEVVIPSNVPVVTLPFPKPVVSITAKHVSVGAGSVSGKVISDEELASIPAFECMYGEWVGPNDLMAGKFRVTAHDFAVTMVLLRHCKNYRNGDGSLPTRRVGELWTALYLAGDVKRGWNHHRWKRIRDFLSTRGHIDWNDHRYEIPTVVKNENKVIRGIACKWEISDKFNHWLQQVAGMIGLNVGGASFVDTKIRNLIPLQGTGKNLRPIPACLRQIEIQRRFDEVCDLMFAA